MNILKFLSFSKNIFSAFLCRWLFVLCSVVVHADENIHPEMISIDGGQVTVYPSRASEPETVSVKSFAIAKTETTISEFKYFLNESGYELDNGKCVGALGGKIYVTWDKPGFQQNDSHPIVCVNWFDVKAYLSWLSNKTGVMYRLPTIAEWNLAFVRGNSLETADQYINQGKCSQNIGDSTFSKELIAELESGKRKYPFVVGSAADNEKNKRQFKEMTLDMYARCSDGYASTSPVEQFESDKVGLHGMVGNVTEWVEDCFYAGKPTRITTSPTGEEVCEPRATKGTSFLSSFVSEGKFKTNFLDTWIGAIKTPDVFLGFRIARNLN